jgi:kynurenine formamidase
MYNGFDTLEHITSRGAERNAIFNVESIVTRGVLVDVAGYHKMEHLPVDHVITPQEIEAVAKSQNVIIGSGDALLIRTGYLKVWERDVDAFNKAQPGVNLATAQWAGENEIAVLAADNSAVETYPTNPPLPVHQEFIRDQGGYLLELLNLDELARDRVYEFMFVVAPLRLDKGLGSPINPIAIC